MIEIAETRMVGGSLIAFHEVYHWHSGDCYVIDVDLDGQPAGHFFCDPMKYWDDEDCCYKHHEPRSWTPRLGEGVFDAWDCVSGDVEEVADALVEYFEKSPNKFGVFKARNAKETEGDPVPPPLSV